jgi:RNA polymerase sporulation-specific sigma factor
VLIKQAHLGDKEARDTVVKENLGLVWSMVRRFQGRGVEPEDLFQIGCIGLMKAIDHFDLTMDVKFSTYAVPMIMGEMKRYLRDNSMIRVSRSLKELAVKSKMIREELNGALGREPTVEEMASKLDVSVEELLMALESTAEVESLHQTIYQGDGNAICLMDKIEDSTREDERVLDQIILEQAMGALTEKEKNIIRLRYFKERTQSEIAKELGVSQVQVSRLEKKILKRMRMQISS